MDGEACNGFLELGLFKCFGTRDDLDLGDGSLRVLDCCQLRKTKSYQNTYAIL